jgi:hypothetical protein
MNDSASSMLLFLLMPWCQWFPCHWKYHKLPFCRKYEEFCAPSVEEFCIITDSTYQKAEVFVSPGVWGDCWTYMQIAIEFPELTSSWIHRFWKWSVKCLMTWDFIYLFQQQTCFSGYSQCFTHIDIYYLFPCIVVSSQTYLFSLTLIRRFLRAAQASCIVRSAPNHIWTVPFNLYVLSSSLSCQTTFPGSFVYIVLSGQLSSRVDFDRLWFPEISSFSGGSIFSFPCKMDT